MNLRSKEGIWLDTAPFRQAGIRYMEHGFYCDSPWGSADWFSFWQDERRRCIDGYEIDGHKITGDHYWYLNYCPISKVSDTSSNIAKKVIGFPDFWDGDYNYFWIREIARTGISLSDYDALKLHVKIPEENLNGGYNIIALKARRRGFSYKAAAIGAKNFFTNPGSLTIYGAYDSKYLYPKGLFSMTMDYINFINQHTAWIMPSDMVNRISAGHIKASYVEYQGGIRIEKGFKSEITCLTFKDNADAARGKDAYDVFFEEAGAFGTPGQLKRALAATQDCVKAGAIQTGMITIFGTSGALESATVDYANMYQRPEAFGFLPFMNVWDDKFQTQKVGFFFPTNWNMEGYYDKQGNSDFEGGKKKELELRKRLIDNGATSTELAKRLQERPLTPSEAIDVATTNVFPQMELKSQLEKVRANKWQETKGMPVELCYAEGEITAKPILKGHHNAITSYTNLPDDQRGCVMIYEQPIDNAPKGLYKIGYDPVRQDEGTSLAAIIVYKGAMLGYHTHDVIVAEYIGRPESAEDIDRIAEMIAEYYNTTIMHENEVSSVKNYFRRIKKLHLLAHQPDAVISKSIKHSKVSRVYGCHMTSQLKDAAERYVKEWLLKVIDYDEHQNPVRSIDKIYSQRLLEELANYNRSGNFDLVSALFMCIFQVQEEELGVIYGAPKERDRIAELNNMIKTMYNTQ